MKINMHIERLVLDGLSVSNYCQPMLRAALENELARLFTANGPGNHLLTPGAVSRISGGDIQQADESDPGHLGQQVARAVYEGVNL
jgi:hypothetical protein